MDPLQVNQIPNIFQLEKPFAFLFTVKIYFLAINIFRKNGYLLFVLAFDLAMYPKHILLGLKTAELSK